MKPNIQEVDMIPLQMQAADTSKNELPPGGIIHRPLRDLVTDQIRFSIITRKYMPGERLTEDRLAKELNVSRLPVREALRVLETEGFVEVQGRKGVSVATISEADVQQVIEVRSTLQVIASRFAATRRTEAQMEQLKEIVDAGLHVAKMDDHTALSKLNSQFHSLIVEMAHNKYLAETIHHRLRDLIRWFYPAEVMLRAEQAWHEHKAICSAIEDRDSELAALLTQRHIENADLERSEYKATK